MMRYVLIVALLFGQASWASGTDAAASLVRDVSQRMLTILKERRAEIDREPSIIFGLVDQIVVPHFDFEKITQSAVGQYWRQATPEQRKALANGFREVLIRTYAQALLNYSARTSAICR
jgi:phospholipid transport system substrate-binding protein